jgi:hypothetical protein
MRTALQAAALLSALATAFGSASTRAENRFAAVVEILRQALRCPWAALRTLPMGRTAMHSRACGDRFDSISVRSD